MAAILQIYFGLRLTTKTYLFKCFENFKTKVKKKRKKKKKGNFQKKKKDIFHISAQNIDCWFSLPRSMIFSKIRKIMYNSVNPSFTI